MVAIIKRMRRLKTLLAVRLGPGAAKLSPEVTRLHMQFALKQEDGHSGARDFWRTCLRRLKYHNPAVPMTVSRSRNQSGSALMTIHFSPPSAAASSPPPVSSTKAAQSPAGLAAASKSGASAERTEIVNMKGRSANVILARLMELTAATEVLPTPEELHQIQELKEFRERSARDAERQNEYFAQLKKEKDILDRARNVVGM